MAKHCTLIIEVGSILVLQKLHSTYDAVIFFQNGDRAGKI